MKNRIGILSVALFLIFSLSVSTFAAENMEKEIKLGQKVAVEVEKRWERISDPAKTARLSMILEKLKFHMTRSLPYDVRIIQENSVNAFSLPGGTIYMTTGILDFLHSDAEIAAILAHEMIHADRSHVMVQMARSQRISVIALALIIATGGQAAPSLLASMAQIAITNSYSRDLEREADVEGLQALVKAGYPSAAMLTVMEGLAEEQLRHPYVDPGIFMDHPYVEERVAYLTQEIRKNGWPLERKKALHKLVVTTQEQRGRMALLVDEFQVWSGPACPEVKDFFLEAKQKLDISFQMELPPYELQVIELPETHNKGLRIGNMIIASEPLPEGVESLELFRSNLVEILLKAKNAHPIADYLH